MHNHPRNLLVRFLLAGVVVIGFTAWPVQAGDAAYAKPVVIAGTLNEVMQKMQNDAEASTPNGPDLKILQGFCGADGSWQDVTRVLQGAVERNVLQVSWQQPFQEIGGDPAQNQVKMLVVSYQIGGKTRFAAFREENFPVGLRATIR